MTIEEKAAKRFLDADVGEMYPGTWREWIKEVLITLVDEGEGFSGKRPLGDSGWEHTLGIALCLAGLLEYKAVHDDKYGEIDYEFSWDDVNAAWLMVLTYFLAP